MSVKNVSIKSVSMGEPVYIKTINRAPLNDNDREVLISGCKYLVDTVDELNEKYNTHAYRLKVILHNGYKPSLEIEIVKSTTVLNMEIPIRNKNIDSIHIGYIIGVEKQISGNTIISLAKQFGRIINVEQITLEDDSMLQGVCAFNIIDMKKLYILSTGISWYNSKGFVSKSFDIEKQHNYQLLSLNIAEFLEYHCNRQPCNDNLNKFFEFFEKYNKQYPFLKENGLVLTKSMTVQEVFTRIKGYILRDMPRNRKSLHKMVCDHLRWLFKAIAEPSPEQRPNTHPYNILYNAFLTYNLIDTPPITRQSILRISSSKRPSTRKTTSVRRRSTKSMSRKRVTIG